MNTHFSRQVFFSFTIYFKWSLGLSLAFGGRRLLVRQMPNRKKCSSTKSFATRSDGVERYGVFDRTAMNPIYFHVVLIQFLQ